MRARQLIRDPAIGRGLIGAGLSSVWLALLIAGLLGAALAALALRRRIDPTVDGRSPASVGG
jgi:hypothetical protein